MFSLPSGNYTIPKELIEKIGAKALNSVMAQPLTDMKDELLKVITRPAIQDNFHGTSPHIMTIDDVDELDRFSERLKAFDNNPNAVRNISNLKQTVRLRLNKIVDDVPPVLQPLFDFSKRPTLGPHTQVGRADRYIIAGGCFTSLLTGVDVNDYDLFLLGWDRDKLTDERAWVVKELDKMANNVQADSHWSDTGRFITFDHANYQKNPKILRTYFDCRTRMQYIFCEYKTRKELIEHFDFVHNCISYDLGEDKLYLTKEVYEANMNKSLRVSKTATFVSQDRIEKYKRRGFTYEVGSI